MFTAYTFMTYPYRGLLELRFRMPVGPLELLFLLSEVVLGDGGWESVLARRVMQRMSGVWGCKALPAG